RDVGYGAVATQIEIIGKLTMLMVSLPVLLQVIETITEIM
ncbi:MAG: stage III sporulation AC/AD family protein, partial [Wujia sp.]